VGRTASYLVEQPIGGNLDAFIGDGGGVPLRESLAGSRDGLYDGSGRIDSSLTIDTQF